MSIATEITRLQTVKQNIRSALVDKGVAAAANHDMEDFPQDIADIPAGSDERLLMFFQENSTTGWDLDLSDLDAVTRIPAYRFYRNASLTGSPRLKSIILPDNVTAIEMYAFNNQAIMEDIDMPDDITSIDTGAFGGCTALALTALPTSLTTLGTQAFQNCNSLNISEIPTGVTTIPSSCFDGCRQIGLITFPNGLTSIASSAFQNCVLLNTAALPSGLTAINQKAFNGCSALALTALPAALKSISTSAFMNCTSLALIALPSGITTIDTMAFQGCTGLTEMDLPATITSLGQNAFKGCTGLEKVKIRASKMANSKVFEDCTALTNKVWISNDCTSITASSSSTGPFQGSSVTDIYCEFSSKPSGWGTYWNRISSTVSATVHWGTTEASFDAIQ